jgi:hypothetical protein
MGGHDEAPDAEEDEDDDNDDDTVDEDPPDAGNLNMRPPDYNTRTYAQDNGAYLSKKRYIRTEKMRLDRFFMELANITGTNLEDHAILFPELYEIYS